MYSTSTTRRIIASHDTAGWLGTGVVRFDSLDGLDGYHPSVDRDEDAIRKLSESASDSKISYLAYTPHLSLAKRCSRQSWRRP